MPTKTKRDEEKWDKAKEIAAEAGKKDDYAYIMGIYKKMKPDYEFKTKKALLLLAAEHPELADEILTAGGWIPGELKDDSWETGHIEERPPPDLDADDGSQVPPARDSKGDLIEKYDPDAYADAWRMASKRACRER